MSAGQQMLLGGGDRLTTSTWSVSYDSSISINSAAVFTLATDGSQSHSGSLTDNSSADHNWYSPTTASIGSSYWVRATLTSGSNPDVGTMGSWLALSSSRAWAQNAALSDRVSVFTLEFATDAAGANIVRTITGNTLARTHS